ncbi:hypothetical protein R2103_11855 [Nitrosomonas sp. Is24]|nr:hypothetical protein [Nitrosomonas sp. Is24]MDV6342462.1 hypothetical protein [Nitrosomonas sp. Is24]
MSSNMQHLQESSCGNNNQRLNELLYELDTFCVNVSTPKGILEHIRYFCGEYGKIEDLLDRNEERAGLYKKIASLLYVYIKIADRPEFSNCSDQYIEYIDRRVDFYVMLRELIRCNVELLHLAPGVVLYESTICLFDSYLYLIKKIQKKERSPQGIRYINSRLDYYIKLREVICFDRPPKKS